MEWHETYDHVVAFARHLVEDEMWTTEELMGYLEKPWKWTDEYWAWMNVTVQDKESSLDPIKELKKLAKIVHAGKGTFPDAAHIIKVQFGNPDTKEIELWTVGFEVGADGYETTWAIEDSGCSMGREFDDHLESLGYGEEHKDVPGIENEEYARKGMYAGVPENLMPLRTHVLPL